MGYNGYDGIFNGGLLSDGISRRAVWLNYADVSDQPSAPISMDDGRIISQKTTVNM